MTGYQSKKAMAQDKLEQRTGEKQMKAYCENCGLLQPASFRPCNDAVTGAFYEDLCCDTCHFIVATVEEREALAQPAQERNFCSRCGKRTADLTTIHTCTPPQEKNNG